MNRREFTKGLAAIGLSPALPTAALANIAPIEAVAINTAKVEAMYFWGWFTARVHNTCSPAMLGDWLKLNPVDAGEIYRRLLSNGAITAPNIYGISKASEPLYPKPNAIPQAQPAPKVKPAPKPKPTSHNASDPAPLDNLKPQLNTTAETQNDTDANANANAEIGSEIGPEIDQADAAQIQSRQIDPKPLPDVNQESAGSADEQNTPPISSRPTARTRLIGCG